MENPWTRSSPGAARPAGAPRAWRLAAGAPALLALSGCQLALMDPMGTIAQREKSLILTAAALMLLVVVPVIVLTLAFAWRYRASNEHATYTPNWSYSHRIEIVVWAIPAAIILVLGTLTWTSTHELDPYRPLASKTRPITVDVIALDWKWLFIYPEQHIASVNELRFPAGTPVNFRITSDTVMNAFFIPQLGSQIYAMAGMQTQLNLMADRPGRFDGLSANFSGAGFPDMTFQAIASSQGDFDAWVAQVKASGKRLGLDNYAELARPSSKVPVTYFSAVEPVLFAAVLDKSMDKSSGLKLADKLCLPAAKVVAEVSK